MRSDTCPFNFVAISLSDAGSGAVRRATASWTWVGSAAMWVLSISWVRLGLLCGADAAATCPAGLVGMPLQTGQMPLVGSWGLQTSQPWWSVDPGGLPRNWLGWTSLAFAFSNACSCRWPPLAALAAPSVRPEFVTPDPSSRPGNVRLGRQCTSGTSLAARLSTRLEPCLYVCMSVCISLLKFQPLPILGGLLFVPGQSLQKKSTVRGSCS